MMSLDTIRERSRQAAARAAKINRTPLLVETEDMKDVKEHLRYMPFLGDYVAPGFELVDTHFVDSSGWGTEGGSAISQDDFFAKVIPGRGYGVVEAGQFQIHIGEFKKV